MDGLDIRILRAMGIVPYSAVPRGPDALRPASIARALGVTTETVRERIARLEAVGIIAGYQAHPNLRHLGLEAAAFLFVTGSEERRARVDEEARPVEGVLDIYHFLGRQICVDLCYRGDGDLQRKLRILSHITGDPSPGRYYAWPCPPVPAPLSHLDWRIVRALRGRAKRPLVDVAQEVGASYRTVKRRYDRMTQEGSLFIAPLVDPGAGDGLLPVLLLVHLAPDAPPETTAAVLRELDDACVFTHVPPSQRYGDFDALAFVQTPKAAEALRQRAVAVEGVARVELLVTREVVHNAEWVDDLIAQRVKETAA